MSSTDFVQQHINFGIDHLTTAVYNNNSHQTIHYNNITDIVLFVAVLVVSGKITLEKREKKFDTTKNLNGGIQLNIHSKLSITPKYQEL